MKKLKEKLYNFWLSIRFKYFKPKNKVTFNGEILYHKDHFENVNEFRVLNEFYNNNDVWFDEKKVSIIDGEISLDCTYNPGEHTSWQGTKFVNWEAGRIDLGTEANPIMNFGTWSITAKVSNCWPAIWLLRERHKNIYGISTITPEVDIMEIIYGKFQHTIHHKPLADGTYSTDGKHNKVAKWDDQYHEFTVDLTKDGYKCYMDGILTAKFDNYDGDDFVSDAQCYLILNNAVDAKEESKEIGFNYPMRISKITVRKNNDTTKWRKL